MSGDNMLDASVNFKNKKVRFLQINLAHRVWAHEALMNWLSTEESNLILCIQEPYFAKKGITKLPQDYGAYWQENTESDMTIKKPRAAIFAPRGLNGYMITQLSSLDAVVVRFDSLDMYVISCYCAIEKDMVNSVQMLSSQILSRKKVVCCLDSNAYNSRWGSNMMKNRKWRGKKRGIELADFFDEYDFFICNQVPHLATFTRDSVIKDESHIDITIGSRQLFNQIINWEVRDETFLSDHREIRFEIEYKRNEKGEKQNQERQIPWKKPGNKMEKVMRVALRNSIKCNYKSNNNDDIDNSIEDHRDKVQQILHNVFRKKQKGRSEVFWWSDEVAKQYSKLRLARRRMRRYKHENLRKAFIECRQVFREVVQKAKIDAWRKFTSEIHDPWYKLIKIVKATTTGRILSRTLHDLNGVYAETMNDTLIMLGKQFYPSPEVKTHFHNTIEYEVECALCNVKEGPKITMCELQDAVKQLSTATAPGFDMITNNVIRELVSVPENERYYLKLFNKCLLNAYFPCEWKKAKVVLIPKPATDLNSVKSFRPISLTSSLAKLFERIVLARLLHYLALSNEMTCNQHAYKKGKSTQTALYELFDVVQYGLHRRGGEKSVCVVVFLDISGAFDKTWHAGILYKLLEYKVPTYLVSWIKSFLQDRKAFFMESDVTYEVNLLQGCPQGGVLSPVLWNVLFNEMLALPTYNGNKRNNRLKVIGYADDAAIICKASSVEEASMLINVHLKKIYEWSKNYRIYFNSSKLAVMTISNRFKKPAPAAVYYNNILIKEVTEYKYLGLLVDQKCTWKPHMNCVLQKLALITRSLRGLSGQNWGINLGIFRMLFHAIFMPVMTYGITIWGWKAIHKNVCAKFDKQIRDFGLLATRCMKSTSSVYIFNLLRTQNFSKILEYQVLKTSVQQFHVIQTQRKGVYDNYCRKRTVREVPQCIDHHFYMCRKKAGGLLLMSDDIQFDDTQDQFRVHPSKWVTTRNVVHGKEESIWLGNKNLGWMLYTDASSSTHGIGWGIVVFCNSFCVHRDSGALTRCSIFMAEAYALLQALLYVHNICVGKNEIIEVCSDAQALVKTIGKEHQTDYLLIKIKNELRKIKQEGKKVVIRWIPSHQNIYGNEIADKLAKKATDTRQQEKMKITNREIKTFLKERERHSEALSWEQFKSRNVKFFLPDIVSLESFLKSNPSVSLCQIVSGHTRLNDFVHDKLGLISSPKCKCMKANETITHFLLDCELYEDERKEIWPNFEATYAFILKDWKLLDNFIAKTNRFKRNTREELLHKKL